MDTALEKSNREVEDRAGCFNGTSSFQRLITIYLWEYQPDFFLQACNSEKKTIWRERIQSRTTCTRKRRKRCRGALERRWGVRRSTAPRFGRGICHCRRGALVESMRCVQGSHPTKVLSNWRETYYTWKDLSDFYFKCCSISLARKQSASFLHQTSSFWMTVKQSSFPHLMLLMGS